MEEEIKLQEIRYYRQVRPPSLKQYAVRRAVKEAMATVAKVEGIVLNPVTGHPVPASALAAKGALKGLTSEKILTEHPEYRQEYEEKYGKR